MHDVSYPKKLSTPNEIEKCHMSQREITVLMSRKYRSRKYRSLYKMACKLEIQVNSLKIQIYSESLVGATNVGTGLGAIIVEHTTFWHHSRKYRNAHNCSSSHLTIKPVSS